MAFELNPDLIRNMISAIESQPLPNRVQLAAIFDVTERTILDWTRDGMPVQAENQRGKGNEYRMIDCVIWLIQREYDRLTRETAKDRLDRTRADIAQIELAEKLGLVARVDELESNWVRDVMACKSELLNLGPRLAAKLTAVLGVEVNDELITGEVEKALAKLVEGGEPAESDDEELTHEFESED